MENITKLLPRGQKIYFWEIPGWCKWLAGGQSRLPLLLFCPDSCIVAGWGPIRHLAAEQHGQHSALHRERTKSCYNLREVVRLMQKYVWK